MEKPVQIFEVKEEFHAVMEDIKPKDLMALDEMCHSEQPPLLKPEKCIKVEPGREVIQEIITIMDGEDPDEIEIVEVVNTVDLAPPVLSPNYGEPRNRRSSEFLDKGLPLLCRLCATRSDGMINMFDPSEQHRNIVQKIEYCCLPVVVKKNDNLSKAACQLCLAKLELSYQFYKTVTEAKNLFTIREQTIKILKTEWIPDESIKKDIIEDDLNDSDNCRTSNLSHEHQDADSSSNALDLGNKEVPLTNVTTVNNVISSDVDHVDEERTSSSDNKRRKTDLASNASNSSTKETPITNTTANENIILPEADHIGKDRTKNSSDNSATKELSITDATVENVDEDRTQSPSDKCRKTDPSSNTSNMMKATLQLRQATPHSVLDDPMSPINSDKEFSPDVERSDFDSIFPPVSRSPEASNDSRKNGVSRHHEQSPCNVSGNQLSAHTEVNTHETMDHDERVSIKMEPTVGIYYCKYCDEQCEGEINLLDHMRVHLNEYPFTCSICDKAFKTRGRRNYHIVTHTKDEPFSCNTCNASFASKYALRAHERSRHQEIKREGRGYRSKNKHRTSYSSSNTSNASRETYITDATVQNNVISSNLNNFGENNSNDERGKTNSSPSASNCSVTPAHRTDATIQNNVISSNLRNLLKESSNDECGRKTNSSSNGLNLNTASFEEIVNSVLDHPSPSTYSDKELQSNKKLGFKRDSRSVEESGCYDFAPSSPPIETNHEASDDPRIEEVSKRNEEPSCNVSEEQIRSQRQVNTRERRCKRPTIIQPKPEKQTSLATTLMYICEDCGRRTKTKALMRDHVLIYHLKKPVHKCKICDRKFRNRDAIKAHMIKHSKEKTYECNLCGARFRWSWHLDRHKRLHTKWDSERSRKIK